MIRRLQGLVAISVAALILSGCGSSGAPEGKDSMASQLEAAKTASDKGAAANPARKNTMLQVDKAKQPKVQPPNNGTN